MRQGRESLSLAGAGILGIYLYTGNWNMVIGILGMAPFSSVADYALTTIPMFILMAFFSSSSGLARDLYTAGANWLSDIKGGLAAADARKSTEHKPFTSLHVRLSDKIADELGLVQGDTITFNGKLKDDKTFGMLLQNVKKVTKG